MSGESGGVASSGRMRSLFRGLSAPLRSGLRWVNAALISMIVLAAFFGNELRSQDWDPMYMRDLVERTRVFGGSYYVNGIHNKGPLEPVVYHVAAMVSSWASYWYAISAFILVCAFVLGGVAAKTFRVASGSRPLAAAVAMAVVIHFTLSGADYGGVLYSRNMTVTLLALAFALLIDEPTWSGARRLRPGTAAVLVGLLLGITMQTLTTATLSVGVLGIAALWLMRGDGDGNEQKRRWLRMGITAAATFSAAPLWYLLRGDGKMFWNSWWVYGTHMTRATGRSFAQQLGLGWSQAYAYYQARPIAAFVIVAFAFVTWQKRAHPDRRVRALHIALLGWWFAGLIEITLTQRYSSHYYSVTSVPNILMAATLFGRLARSSDLAERQRWASGALAASMVGTIFFSNPVSFINGIQSASSFRGFEANLRAREQGASGGTQTARALLDLVSRPNDPLLMWTNVPWPYLAYQRVSATRFIWKSFLMGEIYLGRTSPDWILPGSWDQWRADLAATKPVAFVEERNGPLDANTPAAEHIQKNFTTVYNDADVRIALRNDTFATVAARPTAAKAGMWKAVKQPDGSSWTVSASSAAYLKNAEAEPAPPLQISDRRCFRLDGEIGQPNGRRSGMAFLFDDPNGVFERRRLAIEETTIAAGSDYVGFGNQPLTTRVDQAVTFTLIVGRDSAGLIVDGKMVAVRLLGESKVSVESHGDRTELRNLRWSDAPASAGCTPTT